MRAIGRFDDEQSARVFSDALTVQGIDHQVDSSGDDQHEMWVLDDDQLSVAKTLLEEFVESPDREDFCKAREKAEQLRGIKTKEAEAYQRTLRSSRNALRPSRSRIALLTTMLMVMSIIVSLPFLAERGKAQGQDASRQHRQNVQAIDTYYRPFLIADPFEPPMVGEAGRETSVSQWLPKVRQGEIWRLLTPIFLHWNLFHLLFNMVALRFLGLMIEGRRGPGLLLALVVVSGVLSNLAQFSAVGPFFGGMSGVVYAMFGYIWICGKLDVTSGMVLREGIVIMVMLWFFLCLVGVIPDVANMVHAVGLGVGAAWGYVDGKRPEWRLKRERRASGSS